MIDPEADADDYIPPYLLRLAEVRALNTPEEKAAHICANFDNLHLSKVCKQLGADYFRAYRRVKKMKEDLPWTGVGRPPLVDESIKPQLLRAITKAHQAGDNLDCQQVRTMFQAHYEAKYADRPATTRDNCASQLRHDYVYEAKERLGIHTKVPKKMGINRNQCPTVATIHEFFNSTYTFELIYNVPAFLIINADETSVEVGVPAKVIVPTAKDQGQKVDHFEGISHMTAMMTLNATGDDFAPFVITPLKTLPNVLAEHVRSGRITFGGSDNGWMTDQLFEEWATWLVQRIDALRAQYHCDADQRAILLLDGHPTRNNHRVMSMFKANNIEVVIFPPHMTHLIQPYDRVIARPFKQALQQFANKILNEYGDDASSWTKVRRLAQVTALIDAHRVATTTINCRKAFEVCGLYPRNPQKILKAKGVKNSKRSYIDNSPSPTGTIKISGHCVTSDNILQHLRKKEKKDAQAPAKKS